MKSMTVTPRSRFLIKVGSEYHLISISFNRLLLAVRLMAPFGTNSMEQDKVHEIKSFAHQRYVPW